MTLTIVKVETEKDTGDFYRCNTSFTVDSEITPRAEQGRITYTITAVSRAYVKRYEPEEYDSGTYLGRPDRQAWLAYVDGQVAGQILVQENWNRFAMIWDLVVDPSYRRQGIGRRLIEEAIAWARQRELPGLMLETQNINVAACRLYERCGFVLGGVDYFLYRGTTPGTNEIALFWYLVF